MKLKFIIEGNQDDPAGNAIPKLKMTGRQHWTPQAKRYVAWKEFVQQIFGVALGNARIAGEAKNFEAGNTKPIKLAPGQKAHMELWIWWKNGAHPDPENVFGSIADALFENDNNLDGSFCGDIAVDRKGRVDVIINIR